MVPGVLRGFWCQPGPPIGRQPSQNHSPTFFMQNLCIRLHRRVKFFLHTQLHCRIAVSDATASPRRAGQSIHALPRKRTIHASDALWVNQSSVEWLARNPRANPFLQHSSPFAKQFRPGPTGEADQHASNFPRFLVHLQRNCKFNAFVCRYYAAQEPCQRL